MTFFTTRERLEIAGVPFAIPEEKPSRRQALAYYQGVATRFALDLASHEEVVAIEPGRGDLPGAQRTPRRLPRVRRGEAPWRSRPATSPGRADSACPARSWPGSSALPRALEPFRRAGGGGRRRQLGRRGGARPVPARRPGDAGAPRRRRSRRRSSTGSSPTSRTASRRARSRRGSKPGWSRFSPGAVEVETPAGRETIAADAAYVLIGYRPATGLLERAGVRVDPETAVPRFDPESGETDVPGLYVAGTVRPAARPTGSSSRTRGTTASGWWRIWPPACAADVVRV